MNKIICECGCEIKKDSLIRHLKTNKHNNIINNNVKNNYFNFIIKKTENIYLDDNYECKEYEHGGDYWDNLNGVNLDDY